MTHKKLILMALMGVMLSDADAGGRKAKQVSPKAHKIGSRGRAQSARGNVVTDAGGAQGGQTDGLLDDGTGKEQELPEAEKKPAQGQVNAPEATQPAVQKPDYKVKKDFGETAQRAFGVNGEDTLENLLKSVLGVHNLNNIKGLSNKLDGFVALGNSDAKLKDNVMTGTMLGVLGLASGKTLKDAVVKMDDAGKNDTGLEISIGEWKALEIGKGGTNFNGEKLATDKETEISGALSNLGKTQKLKDFFNSFTKIGLLVGDELKGVGLDEFDEKSFATDMFKILESKNVVDPKNGHFKDNMPFAITSSMQEYVNNKWVKPLFDNIKQHVDGEKPVFAVYVDADGQVTKNTKETFSTYSNVKKGMRFVPADTKKALLNLVRIKKGDNTIFNVDPALEALKNDVTMKGDDVKTLAGQLQQATAQTKGNDTTFADILADKKGRQTLQYAQDLLGKTPKVQGINIDKSAFIAKLTELFNEDKAVKKVANAKNDKDKKAAQKALNDNFTTIMTGLVEKASTAAKGPGRFETKAAESTIG
jgi:hypothetical protein